MSRVNAASVLACALLGAGAAFAQSTTYRCVDDSGRSTYTNVKEEMAGKKCVVVSREVSVVPLQPPPAPAAAKAAPPSQPAAKADPKTQSARDSDRRKILESELDSEQKLLADARQKLTEQEGIRTGDERNFARVLERLKPFQDRVQQHEQNVAQLRKELSNLR